MTSCPPSAREVPGRILGMQDVVNPAPRISQIEIFPLPPRRGLVGFASCVLDDWLFLSGIALHAKLDGSLRLVFPVKRLTNGKTLALFHPVSREGTEYLTAPIAEAFWRVWGMVERGEIVVKKWPGNEETS